MGASVSHAAAPPPPPPSVSGASVPPPVHPLGTPPPGEGDMKGKDKVDWLNLPCPIPFEEIQREVMNIIEDLYSPRTASIDFITELVRKRGKENLQRFLAFIVEVFRRYDEAAAGYKPYRQKDGALLAIGALCDKLKQTEPYKSQLEQMLVQHVFPEFSSQVGHLRAKLTNEPHFSQGMFNFDYKGKDFRTQFQLGNNAFYGANYIQIATGQIASTGIVSLSYVQRVSEKVSLASDFMYNHMSGDTTASFGYDYLLRQCRLRGRLDTNGCTAAYLEERLNMGVNFVLSAEIDHWKKDYKFGFGMTVGEL